MLSFLGAFDVYDSIGQSDSKRSSSVIPCQFSVLQLEASVAVESIIEFITVFKNTLLWQRVQTLQKQDPAEQ